MRTVRVLIVDDHLLFRQGLRWALSSAPDIEIVGEAGTGEEALRLAHELTPDIVICDIHLPDMVGTEVARSLKMRMPQTAVILITAYEDDHQVFEAIRVGAAAYFLKDMKPDELLRGIRRVSHGEYIINEFVISRPAVASKVLNQFREVSTRKEMEPLFVPLSAREIEILDYIARGNSNKQIARALSISDQTVKNHITSILKKLAVNDRTEAVVFAIRRGWIKMDVTPS